MGYHTIQSTILLFLSLLIGIQVYSLSLFGMENNPPSDLDRIGSVLERARMDIFQKAEKGAQGPFWNMPLYLGSLYVSQYFLALVWLNQEKIQRSPLEVFGPETKSKFIEFKKLILRTRSKKDGSWEIISDPNLPVGNINATIMNYAFLKAFGEDPSSPEMALTRKFILDQGGVEKSSLFTKIFLCLFGNYSWDHIPQIPYFVLSEKFPINYHRFGQWVGPHLFPIAYFKNMRVEKNLGSQFDLSELKIPNSKDVLGVDLASKKISPRPHSSETNLMVRLLKQQKEHGSIGGYTSATIFSAMAFDHYLSFAKDQTSELYVLGDPALVSKIELAKQKAIQFDAKMYLDSKESTFLGTTCDGRFWDTALVGQGLLEAGERNPQLFKSVDYLLSQQDSKTGGFGFGWDLSTYPDTDDTAEILLFFKKALLVTPKNSQENVKRKLAYPVTRAREWLHKMQNKRDGGWGAFSHNNYGNPVLDYFTKDFLDSADIYDESSADVTAHVLESLGEFGENELNSQVVRDGIGFLRDTQKDGIWLGRWGTNYIYGTSAAIIGLSAVGIKSRDPMIKHAVQWIESCPNEDGGFGESFYSYTDIKFQCHGLSTPTQTAWALMALVSAGRAKSKAAQRAALYLLSNFEKNGSWIDGSVVGTGHPKVVPMQYPSYSKSFTLMALARFRNSIN